MALFKSDEEKAAEKAQKDQEAAAQQAAYAQQQAAAQKAADDAAFAASLATTARAAGNTFFQIEIDVSELTGPTSFFGSSSNTVQHNGSATDVLGQIEEVGWHLEHVGFVFIETGATSTDRVFLSGQGTVTQGTVTGIYLFRRTSA